MKKNILIVIGLFWGGIIILTYSGSPKAEMRNLVGKIMPSDAAPLDRQVFRFVNDEPTNLDIGVAIYEVGGIVFLYHA